MLDQVITEIHRHDWFECAATQQSNARVKRATSQWYIQGQILG